MAEPIRVLHVIGIMNRGGAETMIMNLYRNIDRAKIQFDFVENEGEAAAFDDEIRALGGKIYHCSRYRGKNHLAYTKWWNDFFASHKGEYPIVHGHIGSTAAIYLSIAKKYGVYTIAHSHNTDAVKSFQGYIYKAFSYPTRFIADHFFACSLEAAQDRYGKSVAKDTKRSQILKNAIDPTKFRFSENARDTVRTELGIKDDSVVFGHVGRFAAQKNHKFLIEIFRIIHEKKPEAILLLIGDGELRPAIKQKVAEYGLQKNVIFTGVQSDVHRFYQAMDAFIFPSVYEGLGIVAIEAQAAGLPCCVADTLPKEAAVTELLQYRSLRDSADEWASWVLDRVGTSRIDTLADIQAAGYDISSTSAWLEKFYWDVAKKHE